MVEFLTQTQPSWWRTSGWTRARPGSSNASGSNQEIAAALESKVWLRSGGYLVINPTEALVAIDVNTGRSSAATAWKTPVPHQPGGGARDRAPDPPARSRRHHRDRPHRHGRAGAPRGGVRAARGRARARPLKTKVLTISEFGLVELTRKRSRSDLLTQLAQSCPYCRGSGRMTRPARYSRCAARGARAPGPLAARRRPSRARAPRGGGGARGRRARLLDELETRSAPSAAARRFAASP